MNLRMRRNPNLNEDTMAAVQACLRRINSYARLFLHAKDFIRERHVGELSIRLLADPTTDLRRYNTPSVDEIAVLTCGNVSNSTYPRDIVLHSHTDRLEHITDLHPAYVPLHYVLLFPYGTPGWSSSIPLLPKPRHAATPQTTESQQHTNVRGQRHVTQADYYSFRH
jgi:hypothetical protein